MTAAWDELEPGIHKDGNEDDAKAFLNRSVCYLAFFNYEFNLAEWKG